VLGDGNCLFRSLSVLLFGEESKYNFAKKMVIEELKSAKEWYTSLNWSVDEWLLHLSKREKYFHRMENFQAFANATIKAVCLHCPDLNGFSLGFSYTFLPLRHNLNGLIGNMEMFHVAWYDPTSLNHFIPIIRGTLPCPNKVFLWDQDEEMIPETIRSTLQWKQEWEASNRSYEVADILQYCPGIQAEAKRLASVSVELRKEDILSGLLSERYLLGYQGDIHGIENSEIEKLHTMSDLYQQVSMEYVTSLSTVNTPSSRKRKRTDLDLPTTGTNRILFS